MPGQISFDANAQAFLRMGETMLHEDLGVAPDATDADATDAATGTGVPGPAPTPSAGTTSEPAADSGPTPVAAWPTKLSGDPQGIVAAKLDRHRRQQVRFDVDWAATLIVGTRSLAVRVVDVSPLPLGTAGTLVFDQLARQPTVSVVVKSVRPEVGRAGVGFGGGEDIRQALVAAAQEHQAPAAADENDEEPTRPLRVPQSG